MTNRTFEDKPATRERVPLLLGLVGPSGSGKTYSALRLATGIQKAVGGDIYFVDTEARRALHYADRFRFRHVAFGMPFGPLDYLAAIEHCVKKGAKTVIVDSMSHEHEGPGGVLEMHEAECERLMKQWKTSREKVQMTAWAKPKQDRRRLINTVLQMPCNFIFCFRAKEKLKIIPGKQPENQGWMPIAGDEFVFEMTMNALLYPGSNGVPVWRTDEPGERKMTKLPEQFRALFSNSESLSEDLGEKMATWALGTAKDGLFSELRDAIAMADEGGLAHVAARVEEIPKTQALPGGQYKALKALIQDRRAELARLISEQEAAANGEVPADQEPHSRRGDEGEENAAQ